MKSVLIWLIRAYRYLLSPWIGGQCRFHPTCSVYTAECIRNHGALRGSWLGVKRIGRCQPFCKGGEDLPPPPTHKRARTAAQDSTASLPERS